MNLETGKTYKQTCWVCDSEDIKVIKESNINDQLDSDNYAITNSDYGITGELSKCSNCGFVQCTKENNVIQYYEDLVDTEYEETRAERKLQEQRILKLISKYKPEGSLLDIGAGSGILVEAALEMGYNAEGVEPSKWLQQKAVERKLPIHQGIFPSDKLKEKYDIIVLVDVIEHVNNPKQLLSEIKKAIKDDGIFILITPDVGSLMPKLLRWRWWHYRVAHIGYFNKKNLKYLTDHTGYKQIKITRPAWYFKLDYLIKRSYKLLPKFLHLPIPRFLKKIVIPINLRDSILGIYRIN
jgi:2-polyprenyl-3-methyl-5-hydroxy-6-metoxy-1,4-benzoquinol methylase